MIRAYYFIIRYQILKNPCFLGNTVSQFFKLTNKEQRIVLDKYFEKFLDEPNLALYFLDNKASYIDNGKERNFFSCYYFDKLLISYNLNTLALMDIFSLEEEKIAYLINYALTIIKSKKDKFKITTILTNGDELPKVLSSNISFMSYMVVLDYRNIKYLTTNDNYPEKERELIRTSLGIAKKK